MAWPGFFTPMPELKIELASVGSVVPPWGTLIEDALPTELHQTRPKEMKKTNIWWLLELNPLLHSLVTLLAT